VSDDKDGGAGGDNNGSSNADGAQGVKLYTSDEKFFADFDFLDELVTPDVIADAGPTPSSRDRVVHVEFAVDEVDGPSRSATMPTPQSKATDAASGRAETSPRRSSMPHTGDGSRPSSQIEDPPPPPLTPNSSGVSLSDADDTPPPPPPPLQHPLRDGAGGDVEGTPPSPADEDDDVVVDGSAQGVSTAQAAARRAAARLSLGGKAPQQRGSLTLSTRARMGSESDIGGRRRPGTFHEGRRDDTVDDFTNQVRSYLRFLFACLFVDLFVDFCYFVCL